MKPTPLHYLAATAIAACGVGAGWFARRAENPPQIRMVAQVEAKPASKAGKRDSWSAASTPPRDQFPSGNTLELFASSNQYEVIARFPSQKSYNAFICYFAQSNVRVIDEIDRLHAMRLSYDEWTDLVSMLEGEDVGSYDSLPTAPGPIAAYQEDAVGFGAGLLPWLGVTSDNSTWGEGVKIAVLDTGVVSHLALPTLSEAIDITPFPGELSGTDGHATGVASLIASRDPAAPGIAPAAEIISIRVGDESGKTDAYSLAAGILAGVDAGARIINISMGTPEDNPLIAEAVRYARDHDVLIVAASGNSQRAEALYPAAYEGVISVGAVDARGEHLDFSNQSSRLSLTAPGYAINAASPDFGTAQVSGTSASAPIVTGAIAATMSNGRGVTMSPAEAAEIVISCTDEAGLPGPDSQYGSGILDLGRIMSRGIPGIIDVAVTSQRLVKRTDDRPGDEVQVTIQNRGTAILANVLIETNSRLGTRQFHAANLAPGAIQTFSMPVRLDAIPADAEIEVTSRLTLPPLMHDVTPQNNHRTDSLDR